MARDFRLPDLGEGLTEAEIVKVLVREGEVIAEDAPLLEVETDKATVEIPSPMSGRVEKIHVEPNQTVQVGHVLVTFAGAGPRPAADRRTVPAPGPRGRVTDDAGLAASGRVVRAPTTAAPPTARAEPTAPAAPGKPLATHVTEPPLPNFEQWGTIERQPLSHL